MKQNKNMINIIVVGFVFVSLTLASWFLPNKTFSDSERRKLAAFPELSLTTISNDTFMTDFEKYSQDQFPLRNLFRSIKAYTSYNLFHELDNHGIYIKDGYAAKLEYPLNESSIIHATDKFTYIYDKYLKDKDMNIYLSVIPDKSYYLVKDSEYLRMDYDKLFQLMQNNMTYAKYIDISHTLDITDYYKTDTHWREEKLIDTAKVLAKEMGVSLTSTYTTNTLDKPFYGVYYGQSALPLPSETIYYLTNDIIDNCIVTNYENNTVGNIYDMKKANGKDPYEMYLSGPVSLITIENQDTKSDKELVIFRDSFASSITPLLTEAYSKITLVDIRYLRSDFLDKFINFNHQDILFLYSSLVLNNSETLN